MKLKIGLPVILLALVPSLCGADERADVLKMAWELFYEGKFEEAAELGEKVYEKGDEYSSALLGLSYMKLGECEKALDRIFYVEGWLDLNMDSVEELSRKEDINSRKAVPRSPSAERITTDASLLFARSLSDSVFLTSMSANFFAI